MLLRSVLAARLGHLPLNPALSGLLREYAVVNFPLAQTGEGIKECELIEWYVKEGDTVERFQELCEVQSDKATIPISSPYDGTVTSLCWEKGAMIPVGDTLVKIDVEGAADDQAASFASDAASDCGSVVDKEEPVAAATNSSPPTTSASAPRKGLASPAVRRLAREKGIGDLSEITGTGPGGRIIAADIEAHATKQHSLESHTSAQTEAQDAPAAMQPRPLTGSQRRPLQGHARMMVEAMTESLKIPHFHLCDEVDMAPLIQLRSRMAPHVDCMGVKLTFLPFVLKATSAALLEVPALNCSLDLKAGEIIQHAHHNIGVAMATPHGLVVPVIKHIESLTIVEIARELARLQEAAAANKLTQEDITGGTLSVSNIGSIGGRYATPIIKSPEVAIVALGKVNVLPRFGPDGGVTAASIMNVSWGGDHRALDGATLARFNNAWKKYVEAPELLLLQLK